MAQEETEAPISIQTLSAFLTHVASQLDKCGHAKLAHDCRNYAMMVFAESEMRKLKEGKA